MGDCTLPGPVCGGQCGQCSQILIIDDPVPLTPEDRERIRNQSTVEIAVALYLGLQARGATACAARQAEQVVTAFLPLIRSYASRYSNNLISADQLAAVGKLAVFEALQRFNPATASFRTYVTHIVRGKISNAARDATRQLRHGTYTDTDPDECAEAAVDWMPAADARLLLDQYLPQIPELEQEVLRRRYYLQETGEAIATALSLKHTQHVYTIEKRALARLRVLMSDDE